MDAAVLAALLAFATALAGHWFGRRKSQAEADGMLASAVDQAMKTVQATYSSIIATQEAQVTAANQRAASAEASAREARDQARLSADESWASAQSARQMQRFLAEVRPLIEAHVPGAGPILARLDQLASPVRAGT